MSEQPESPATPGDDEPAAPVPDQATVVRPTQATVVHPTVSEPTSSEPTVGEAAGSEPAPAPAPAAEPSSAPAWTPPAPPQDSSGVSGAAAVATDRPEVAVGAAFAGGLVLALILKRLAR